MYSFLSIEKNLIIMVWWFVVLRTALFLRNNHALTSHKESECGPHDEFSETDQESSETDHEPPSETDHESSKTDYDEHSGIARRSNSIWIL